MHTARVGASLTLGKRSKGEPASAEGPSNSARIGLRYTAVLSPAESRVLRPSTRSDGDAMMMEGALESESVSEPVPGSEQVGHLFDLRSVKKRQVQTLLAQIGRAHV